MRIHATDQVSFTDSLSNYYMKMKVIHENQATQQKAVTMHDEEGEFITQALYCIVFHFDLRSNHLQCYYCATGPDSSVECPLRGTGGHGFHPGPRHTKVVKNGTSCSSLGSQIYGVELVLVDPVSG